MLLRQLHKLRALQTTPVVYNVNSRVNATSRNCEENQTTGSVVSATNDLEMLYNGADLSDVGVIFTGLNIPIGATITNAYIRFNAFDTRGGTCNMDIYGEKANASNFVTSGYNLSNRTRTTSKVAWNIPSTTANNNFDTPDIKAIVQEIVNRTGYAASDQIGIILDAVSGDTRRTAKSYQFSTALAPILYVTYQI